MTTSRVLLLGYTEPHRLEQSYRSAFETLGCVVCLWDVAAAAQRYARLGPYGRMLNRFLPVESWERKANREMVLKAADWQPDIIVVVGNCPVQPGALAQAQILTNARLIHIWPDTLANLSANRLMCLPVYDIVATYCQVTVPYFEKLGARHVIWLPLAGDPCLHALHGEHATRDSPAVADVAFIGGWRPEREAVLTRLGDFDLKIWGPDWGARCKGNHVIERAWQGRAVYGAEFARLVACSKSNLNIIDPTNYPAANMRFFEIPVAGGLQVSSSCPEMEEEFKHGEHIYYYKHVDELPGLLQSILNDERRAKDVASAAHAKVMAGHTYVDRARSILEEIDRGQASD